MNKRIIDLAIDAGFIPVHKADHVIYDISTQENIEHFARLIIEECLTLCTETQAEYTRSWSKIFTSEHHKKMAVECSNTCQIIKDKIKNKLLKQK